MTSFRNALTAIAGLVIALVVIALCVLLHPFVRLRFGFFNSERIGHLFANTERALRRRALGLDPGRQYWLLFHNRPANGYAVRLYQRCMPHTTILGYGITFRVFLWAEPYLRRFPWHIDMPHTLTDYLENERGGTTLWFTEQENEEAWRLLGDLGLPRQARYICVHARSAEYLKTTRPEADLSYHDYRDSSIESFIPAIRALCDAGYFVIRMGAYISTPLPIGHERFIDYAHRGRSEFLDVFLGAHCEFFLGDSCGLTSVPMAFGRPLALTNGIPYMHTSPRPSSQIVKLLRDRVTGKDVPFSQAKAYNFFNQDQKPHPREYLKIKGLDSVDNTPDELRDFALDMINRLTGHPRDPFEQALEISFHQRFYGDYPEYQLIGPISGKFLKRHLHLVPEDIVAAAVTGSHSGIDPPDGTAVPI